MKIDVDFSNHNMWLEIMLDLGRKPVGIKFLSNEQEFQQSQMTDAYQSIVYCTAVRNASIGKGCKLSLKSIACMGGARALGFIESDEVVKSGKCWDGLGVYRDIDVARQVSADMINCTQKSFGVEIAPLESFQSNQPDVLLFITKPYYAMRLMQGYAYHFGQVKEIKMTGMNAICQECTSYPFERGQINVSLLCSGTRCVAQWGIDELGIGIPYHQVEDVIIGLLETSNAMDLNNEKKRIMKKLKEHDLEHKLLLRLGDNYFTGKYGNPEQIKIRENKW